MIKEGPDRGALFSPPSLATHLQCPPSWLGMTQDSKRKKKGRGL